MSAVGDPSSFVVPVPGGGPGGADAETLAWVFHADKPRGPTLLFAPGAGAPQGHELVRGFAERVAREGLDVVTFDFLYAHAGRRLPDPAARLRATYRAAIAATAARVGPLLVGGRSMGGRIASEVLAEDAPTVAAGLVLVSYPLVPASRARASTPRRPAAPRDAHLPRVGAPVLFVQGERDELGDAATMGALAARLGARLHVVPGADHSLRVTRASGVDRARELDRAARAVADFAAPPR